MDFLLNEGYNLVRKVPYKFNIFALASGIVHGITIFLFNKSVKASNNPALPAANERLQILLTYFISVVAFKTKINLEKIGTILLIIFGAFITVIGNYKRTNDLTWLKYSLGAIVGQSLSDIGGKKALNTTSLGNYLRQDLIMASLVSLILQYVQTKKLGLKKLKDKNEAKIKIFNKYPSISITIAILTQILLIYFMAKAIKIATNVAYPKAVFGLSSLMVLIMSYLFEKGTKISTQEIIGNIIVIFGVIGTAIL